MAAFNPTDRRLQSAAGEPSIDSFLDLGEKLRSHVAAPDAADLGATLSAEEAEVLFQAIEGEIIPRLMLAQRDRERSEPTPIPLALITPQDHEDFLQRVMQDSARAAHAFVGDLLLRGVDRESIFLDLLASAARRLGELWEEDECDFAEVTIGLCRLHQVLREQSLLHDEEHRGSDPEAPRILLATACADQHVFGVVMVAEFFRRAGWRVWSEPGAGRDQLAGLLGERSFDVLGLSAACSAIASELCDEVDVLRRSSCNPQLKVLVGGRLFLDEPELVDRVGADASADDARQAPEVGKGLLRREATPLRA